MKKMSGNISILLAFIMTFTLFTGFGTINAGAIEVYDFGPPIYLTIKTGDRIYNFSELTETAYATKNDGIKVFDDAVILTAAENAAPVAVDFSAGLPDGGTM